MDYTNKVLGASEANKIANDILNNEADKRRVVKIGFNLLAVDTVDDNSNSFHCNFLVHLQFPYHKTWRPWIQFKNATQLEVIENPGAVRYTEEKLKNLDKKEGEYITESTNYVGTFAKPLDIRAFPFDIQELTLTVVSNSTKDVVLTEMNKTAIKANFEYDTLSEWEVLRENPTTTHAVSWYSFESADAKLSAAGNSYNNFHFHVIVKREVGNVFYSIVLPSTLLAFSCLTAFSMDVETKIGDRFSIVFTLILTIVANQLITKERLPNVPYLTVIDYYLYSMQGMCYLVAIETATMKSLSQITGIGIGILDFYGFLFVLAIFLLIILGFILKSLSLINLRNETFKKAVKLSKKCRE